MKIKLINILKLSYYLVVTVILLKPIYTLAQQPPDRDYLFLEDSLKTKERKGC